VADVFAPGAGFRKQPDRRAEQKGNHVSFVEHIFAHLRIWVLYRKCHAILLTETQPKHARQLLIGAKLLQSTLNNILGNHVFPFGA
jgi:hypothetical protein